MKKILVVLLIVYFCNSLFSQTILQKETIEGNELKLKFLSTLQYKLKEKNNFRIFQVPNYQNEARPGDVKLPSQSVFISLPFFEKPEIKFSIISKKEIQAVPEFNDFVSLKKKKLIYSKPLRIYNSKTVHFEVKGYLWIGNNYCLHLEVTPAVYISALNQIELINEFEVTLFFSKSIQTTSSNQTEKGKVFVNTGFELIKNPDKGLTSSSGSWIDYNKWYVKLGTAKDGIYRISKQDLDNLGISTSTINPKTFKIFLKGEQIPIYVNGEDDLSFDDNDFIEFVGVRNLGGHHREVSEYGQPYNEYLGRYTDTTAYWLTWDGVEGERVKVLSGNEINSSDTLNYYTQIDHYEKDKWFDFSSASLVRRESPYWTENKTWHEGNLSVRITNKRFRVSDVVPAKTFKMFAKFQDYASDILTNAHFVSLGLNSGNWGDSVYLNKYQKIVLTNELSTDLLNNGNNNLSINSMPTEATINLCIFDWYEVEYPRYLIPFEDSLNFSFSFLDTIDVAKTINLKNIISNNFSIWRYGDKLVRYTPNKIGNQISFTDSVSANSKFCFTDNQKILRPKFYYLKRFINLRNSDNKADYIAITHDKFINQATEYCQFISENYNIDTKLVNINDIYDEFSYGFFNPEAIRDFLQTTHSKWQTPVPKFVFLIGSATYDYYGNKFKNFNNLPSRKLNYVPSFGAPVSDVWFVVWDTTGAGIPQMNIGRVPVETNDEFDWYIQKHKNYVSQKYNEWNKRFLFFSGGELNDSQQLALLKNVNDNIINNYVEPPPIGGIYKHFYKTTDPITNFGPYSSVEIQNAIDSGAVFISYLGHSGTQTWDNSISQSEQLENKVNRNPMITDFGCSTGKYAEPDVVSFSEKFTVKGNGQAISYIGNSSLGFLSTATTFPQIFYKKFLQDSIYNIGDAHRLSKVDLINNYGNTEVNNLFVLTNELVGDPIVSLQLPPKPNFVLENSFIKLKPDLPSDVEDSVEIIIRYYNYGLVPDDSLIVSIEQTYQNNIVNQWEIKRQIPNFEDSFKIKLGVKNKAGRYVLHIFLDSNEQIDEIYEDDNSIAFEFNVLSGSIKFNTQYLVENEISNEIKILNPVKNPFTDMFDIEISTSADFINKESQQIKFGTLYSTYDIPSNYKNKRIWLRAKLSNSDEFSKTISVFNGLNNGFILNDSISFANSSRSLVRLENQKVILDSNNIKLEVISAGFNDGNAAVISKNSQNVIPDNTLRGHYVSVFRDSTYDYVETKLFDLLAGGTAKATEYLNFLDTLSSDYIVCFAVKDEGAINLTDELKSKIKEFGSIFIDSLVFRGSWAMIGKKGAVPGSVPEAFSIPFGGRVKVDTIIQDIHRFGSLLTSLIGPATHWKKLIVSDSLPSNSRIDYRILGLKTDSEYDTLNYVTISNGEGDLSFLNSLNYNYVKVLAEFKASADAVSPILKSLGVSYTGVPELGTNYQVVSVDKDSVEQGENVNLSFYVYNVGESSADSFKVKVNLVRPDNSSEQIFETMVDSLGSEKRMKFDVVFNTVNYSGPGQFNISIDTDDKVMELFEDNNFYSIPFYVKGDTTKPSLNITFDGEDIFEGEYISATPHIKIELSDPSLVPINDTSAITVFLNDEPVYYSENQNILSITFSNSNPKAVVNYTPTLEDGEYTLTVFGKDASGNIADSAGVSKSFVVDNEAKMLNLYNYPNPFSSDTYFTFKLTQIPDEINIKVYTIAGRLVKEIRLAGEELNYDFNRIYWDGRDEDGDLLANGVYIYKVIMYAQGKTQEVTQKLAIVR